MPRLPQLLLPSPLPATGSCPQVAALFMSRLFLTDTHTHTHRPIDTYVSYRCNCIRGTRKLVICRLHQPERQPNPFGNATKNNKRTREAREIRQKKRERQRERQKKETVSKMCLKMGQSMRHKQNKNTHTRTHTITETNPNEMAFTVK